MVPNTQDPSGGFLTVRDFHAATPLGTVTTRRAGIPRRTQYLRRLSDTAIIRSACRAAHQSTSPTTMFLRYRLLSHSVGLCAWYTQGSPVRRWTPAQSTAVRGVWACKSAMFSCAHTLISRSIDFRHPSSGIEMRYKGTFFARRVSANLPSLTQAKTTPYPNWANPSARLS